MASKLSLSLQVVTVVLLGLILVHLMQTNAHTASDRDERLLERLIDVAEHNGNQLYEVCLTQLRDRLYGPTGSPTGFWAAGSQCEQLQPIYVP